MASLETRCPDPFAPVALVFSLALVAGCSPGPAPGASTSTPSGGPATPSVTASTAAAPPVLTPTPTVAAAPSASGPAVPFASAAPARGAGNCYPAAKSRDYGSHAKAEPPFAECAASLKVHCDAADGERGGLHGLALLVDVTKEARKSQPDACCYSSCK